MHDIYTSFDCSSALDVRGIFFDISQALDIEYGMMGLIYKLKCTGMYGMFLKLIPIFLENRFQRVVLNGQTSSWEPVLVGVPQGSALGALFFPVDINNLSKKSLL